MPIFKNLGESKNILNKKGSTLAITIMVMMVLSILSLSLFSIARSEVNQAIRYDNNIKARYYAKSGADIALFMANQELKSSSTTQINQQLWGTVHRGLSSVKIPDDYIHVVITTKKEAGNHVIKIRSKGFSPTNMQEEASEHVVELSIIVPLPGNSTGINGEIDSNYPAITENNTLVEGVNFLFSDDSSLHVFGWSSPRVNGQGHIFDTFGKVDASSLPVVFDNAMLAPSNIAMFRAPEVHFNDYLQLVGNANLSFQSNLTVFHDNVTITGNASLCLEPINETGYVIFKKGVTVRGGSDIQPGAYFFSEKMCFPNHYQGLVPVSDTENKDASWRVIWH